MGRGWTGRQAKNTASKYHPSANRRRKVRVCVWGGGLIVAITFIISITVITSVITCIIVLVMVVEVIVMAAGVVIVVIMEQHQYSL